MSYKPHISRYHIFLISLFSIVWIWAAINPLYRDGWLLENLLIFLFVPIIFLIGKYFKLSNVSYTLITVFIIMHVVGSHYTYAEMPFGYVLQDWTGADRNMYDRLVHYSFGFLLAYPIREIFMRVSKTKGLWSYYFPFELVLAFSGLYEVVEWIAAARVDPAAGLAFLGTQGDIWDAQKDMILASAGALFAMLFIAAINFLYDKNFAKEIMESIAIERGDNPIGEMRLRELFAVEKKTFARHLFIFIVLACAIWIIGYFILNSLIEVL